LAYQHAASLWDWRTGCRLHQHDNECDDHDDHARDLLDDNHDLHADHWKWSARLTAQKKEAEEVNQVKEEQAAIQE
jgi:hypothetical protein